MIMVYFVIDKGDKNRYFVIIDCLVRATKNWTDYFEIWHSITNITGQHRGYIVIHKIKRYFRANV